MIQRLAAGIGALALLALPMAAASRPDQVRRLVPPCIFHLATGMHCPGCGGTRAVLALFRGDVLLAFQNNALWPVAFAAYGWLLAGLAIYAAKDHWIGMSWGGRYLPVAIATTVVAFFVLRNLPWYPFTLLAPIPVSPY